MSIERTGCARGPAARRREAGLVDGQSSLCQARMRSALTSPRDSYCGTGAITDMVGRRHATAYAKDSPIESGHASTMRPLGSQQRTLPPAVAMRRTGRRGGFVRWRASDSWSTLQRRYFSPECRQDAGPETMSRGVRRRWALATRSAIQHRVPSSPPELRANMAAALR